MRLSILACSLLTLALCGGCGEPLPLSDAGVDSSVADAGMPDAHFDAGPPRALFVLPRDGEPFFDLPWPSDVRRSASGVDMSAFPNPRGTPLLRRYLTSASARQRGFATSGAVYFRFSRALDLGSLPAEPAASLAPGASAFLLDVTPGASAGTRHPVEISFEPRRTIFWPGNTLALRPVSGITLAGGHTFAAVITRDLRSLGGEALARDADLEAILGSGGDAEVEAARALYADAISAVEAAGTARDQILSIAVFTTQDPVEELRVYRDFLHDTYPAPSVTDWALLRTRATFVEITGRFGPVPVFQEGTIPYQDMGGAMEPDAAGAPIVHSEITLRFSLTVPVTEMPPAGYPLVLYSHGTGGDYRSFVGDGTAAELAQIGYAVMGIDQIHHGERNPTTTGPELLFFNILNPDAARDNNRQSALDIVQQARAVPALVVPRDIAETMAGEQIHFDTSNVFFYGHSQGGLVGPLFLGIDDSVRGAVLSAGSCQIGYALLEKVEPISIPEVLRVALGLPGGTLAESFERERMSLDHPVITLIQGWVEASDGCNFGPRIFADRRDGFSPISVLATEGLADEYSPPGAIEALATSMRVPLIEPVARPVPGLAILGLSPMSAPLSGNVAGGAATGGLAQYPGQGHFVVFNDEGARTRVRGFFESMRDGSPATIP